MFLLFWNKEGGGSTRDAFNQIVALSESPLAELMNTDKSLGPRCLHLHGWLYSLFENQAVSTWTSTPSEDISKRLKSCLRSYGPDMIDHWVMGDEFDVGDVASCVPDSPNTWSEDSEVRFRPNIWD